MVCMIQPNPASPQRKLSMCSALSTSGASTCACGLSLVSHLFLIPFVLSGVTVCFWCQKKNQTKAKCKKEYVLFYIMSLLYSSFLPSSKTNTLSSGLFLSRVENKAVPLSAPSGGLCVDSIRSLFCLLYVLAFSRMFFFICSTFPLSLFWILDVFFNGNILGCCSTFALVSHCIHVITENSELVSDLCRVLTQPHSTVFPLQILPKDN